MEINAILHTMLVWAQPLRQPTEVAWTAAVGGLETAFAMMAVNSDMPLRREQPPFFSSSCFKFSFNTALPDFLQEVSIDPDLNVFNDLLFTFAHTTFNIKMAARGNSEFPLNRTSTRIYPAALTQMQSKDEKRVAHHN